MSAAVDRAAMLVSMRRPAEALDALAQADGEALELPLYWHLRAIALSHLQRSREAIEAAGKALELAPLMAALHELMARLRIDTDELPEAELACLRAISLDPEDPDPWCVYAHACALAGQLPKAWALLDKAASIDPESTELASTRVSVAWLSADPALTERHSKALLALDPENERGLTMLGISHATQGKVSDGMAVLRGAVLANPRPDGPVRVAEQVRVLQHWAMWPQRLIARFGIAALWFVVMGSLFSLSALDAPGWAFLAVGGLWLLLVLWSWVAPAMVRRSMRHR